MPTQFQTALIEISAIEDGLRLLDISRDQISINVSKDLNILFNKICELKQLAEIFQHRLDEKIYGEGKLYLKAIYCIRKL